MTQQTSSEALEEIAERISARFVSGNSVAVERTHITSDEWRAISGHIPAVKALREENERLKIAAKYAEHIDATPENQLQTMLYDTCIERDALKSQLAELRQGGESVGEVTVEFTSADSDEKRFTSLVWDESKIPAGTHEIFINPQPAIPPGYAVVKRSDLEHAHQQAALAEQLIVNYAAAGLTMYGYLDDSCSAAGIAAKRIEAMLASAPAIQPQAAAPSVPVAEGDKHAG